MALINCPGCGKSISEHAQICPHCEKSVPEMLAQKEFASEIKELQKKAQAFLDQKNYPQALETLKELQSLTPDNATVAQTILKVQGLLNARLLKEKMATAQAYAEQGDYANAAAACRMILAQDPENSIASQLLEECEMMLAAAKKKSTGKILAGVFIVILLAVSGAAGFVYFDNGQKVKEASHLMETGDLNQARSVLRECILPRELPFLAPGYQTASEQLEKYKKLKTQLARVEDSLEKQIKKMKNIGAIKAYPGKVWEKILQDTRYTRENKTSDQPGNYEKRIASFRAAVTLLPLAEAESLCLKAAQEVNKNYDTKTLAPSAWESAESTARGALQAYQAGMLEKAERLWVQAAKSYRQAGEVAYEKDQANKRAAAYAEQEKRERERAQMQSEKRGQALSLVRRLNTSQKNSIFYEKGRDAARDGNWSKAYDYYRLASKYKFSQTFSGRLGFTSKWRLDGNWANEHRISSQISRGDRVYLFVQSTSGSGIDFYLKTPRGRKEWISDRDYENIDYSGPWKIGAEAKGRVSYRIAIEVIAR